MLLLGLYTPPGIINLDQKKIVFKKFVIQNLQYLTEYCIHFLWRYSYADSLELQQMKLN